MRDRTRDEMVSQSADTVVQQETVEFMDTEVGDLSAGLATTDTAFIGDDQVDDATLAKFLARPVRIANVAWSTADSEDKQHFAIRPWYLFMSDPRIKRKLDNFAFIRGNLKLKVMVNASPFYSGYALVSYQPLPSFTPGLLASTMEGKRIQLSQRPHLWVNVQANQAGEMTLPFFWPQNWLALRSALDAQSLGELKMTSYTLLRSANAAVTNPVTVQVYAWLEDVKLSGSTLALAMQSRDEYGDGPISGPASALAKVAATFEPTFGRFATATRMIANTTAGVAKLFGFTNVPVLDEAKPLRVAQNPNFASSEIGYPVNKLVVDSKNELSVDPTILGLPNKDEMTIESWVTRPSYCYKLLWSTTHSVDRILAYQNVTAATALSAIDGSYTVLTSTPMGYVANMFDAWRGDVKFTFWVAATKYHKGRLRITYDPQGSVLDNVVNTNEASSGAYTVFIDLSESAEASITIPYQQALPFLRTKASGNPFPSQSFQVNNPTPAFNMNPELHNGAFTVRVATELSAPVDTSSVDILVFVEGCSNVEFANPTYISSQVTPFVPQSCDTVLGAIEVDKREQRGLMNYGEVVRSLRTLCRRATSTAPFVINIAAENGVRRLLWANRKIPPYPGYDPGSIYSGVKALTAGNAPYTWGNMSHMQYVMLAFVAYRGSTFWYYTPHFPRSSARCQEMMKVSRRPNGSAWRAESGTFTISTTSASVNALSLLHENDAAGTMATIMDLEGSAPIQISNMSRYLFQSTSPLNATAGTPLDESDKDCVECIVQVASSISSATANTNPTWVEAYCGAGTDFSCHFFLNTPVLYYSHVVTPTP